MNDKNKLTGIIAGALVVIAIVAGIFWYQDRRESMKDKTGTLYIGITDATADIDNVSEIQLEMKKVEIYSATEGWTTVTTNSEVYDLLKLNAEGKTELYVKEDIKTGPYDRVRITIGDTFVRTKNNGDVKAYSLSKQVVMDMVVNVNEDASTHLALDFLGDKSLHSTSNGEYVFAPVVVAESRSGGEVAVGDSDEVEVLGGVVDSTATVGVDLDGVSRTNFTLMTGADLRVDGSILGSAKFMSGGKTYTENNETQENVNVNGDGETEANSNDDGTKIDTKINTGMDTGNGSTSINTSGSLNVGL